MGKPVRAAACQPPENIDKIGRVTTESVRKGTGRGWTQWINLLDRAGARSWPHGEITLLLKSRYKLTPWWQQGVAIGYELHTGRRIEGRNDRGLYATVATKTIPLAQKRAWILLASESGLAAWLDPFSAFPWRKGAGYEVSGGVFGEVRTVKPPERLRLSWREESWAKPSVVQLGVHPRKGEKCMVVIQHEGIPNARLKEQLRARWKESLARIAALAAGEGKA